MVKIGVGVGVGVHVARSNLMMSPFDQGRGVVGNGPWPKHVDGGGWRWDLVVRTSDFLSTTWGGWPVKPVNGQRFSGWVMTKPRAHL